MGNSCAVLEHRFFFRAPVFCFVPFPTPIPLIWKGLNWVHTVHTQHDNFFFLPNGEKGDKKKLFYGKATWQTSYIFPYTVLYYIIRKKSGKEPKNIQDRL